MRRFNAFLLMLLVVCILHFFYGCATVEANRQRHTKATQELNVLESVYMAEYKDADFKTQVQWRYRIDPQLRKARFTLFSWDIAISVHEDVIALEKERSFLIAKDKLISTFEEVR